MLYNAQRPFALRLPSRRTLVLAALVLIAVSLFVRAPIDAQEAIEQSMASQALEDLKLGRLLGATKLDLRHAGLTTLPLELMHLASTLEHLDLSSNPNLVLPDPKDFPYHLFGQLRIIFFSDCRFKTFPIALKALPAISMLSFRSNGMKSIPSDSLPSTLRWGIFTSNKLTSLPPDIGNLPLLEKLMLAGNRLESLPDEMANCKNLTLLRISCNRLETIPEWLFSMPRLSFLAFSGNPATIKSRDQDEPSAAPDIPSSAVEIGRKLGEGASGIITLGVLSTEEHSSKQVAVKTFKSTTITSDGSPVDEMTAALLAGSHSNLVSVIGRLHSSHTETLAHGETLGLVLELIPPSYVNLGLPPTFQSCTRDAFDIHPISTLNAKSILTGIADVAVHLHSLGITHGDLYAHNILFSRQENDGAGHALLSDFGAATIYGIDHPNKTEIEKLEVRAFGYLVEDVMRIVKVHLGHGDFLRRLKELRDRCVRDSVEDRMSFVEIRDFLARL